MPGPGSLQRHFARWLAGGAAAIVVAAILVAACSAYLDLAAQQDARLVATARRAGAASDPQLYFAEIAGVVVRATRPAGAAGASAATSTLAEPLSLRLPGMRQVFSPSVIAAVAGAAAMLAIAWLAWLAARRWIARSLAGFEQQADAAQAPAELRPTLERFDALRRAQDEGVDAQRRFLADAAHQLRTPLAVLRAEVQEALHAEGDPRAKLQGMLHTVDRATTVANHLLSLSRVEQLRRDGDLAVVTVAPCVRDAIIELSPLISAKRLEFSLDGEGFEAAGDAVMLGELVRNLLGNAIHHSPPGAQGGIVLRTVPSTEIIVWDEGPGIDDALKPRLFTPFGAGRGGVGLGLSICQQVAAAMGAQVHLYNRVEDGRVCGVDAVVRWAAPAP